MKNLIANPQDKVVQVSVAQLVAILITITKSTFASIIYFTDESKSRTINKAKALQKRTYIPSVALNHKYSNKVNNALKKALENGTITKEELLAKFNFDVDNDTFVAKELKGKTRLSSTILRSDKTQKPLLDAKVLKSVTPQTAYFHNGSEISREDAITQDLFTPSTLKPKTTMGRGLLPKEEDFNIINTALDKIEFLKVNGTVYEVIK